MLKIPKEIRAIPWPEPHTDNPRVRALIAVNAPVVDRERMLVVTIMQNPKYKEPGYYTYRKDAAPVRIVCSKKQRDCAAYIQGGKGVTRPTAAIADRAHIHPSSSYIEITEREEKLLASWIGADKTTNHHLDNLHDYLQETESYADACAREQRGEILDFDYTLCPNELPEGLLGWVRREVLTDDHVIVYKKGNVRGLCYTCGNRVHADQGARFKQSQYVRCPACGEISTCVLEGGDRYKADFVTNIAAVQMGTDGKTVFVREWHVLRAPDANFEPLQKYLQEFARYAVRGKYVAKWLHEYKENYYMNSYRVWLNEWRRFQNVTDIYDYGYKCYTGGMEAAVAGTKLQYAELQRYMREVDHPNVIRYMMDFARYPVLEFFMKAGYKKIVSERTTRGLDKEAKQAVLWQRTTLAACFRVPLRLLKIKEPQEWTLAGIAKLNKLWAWCEAGKFGENELPKIINENIELEHLDGAIKYAALRRIINYLSEQRETNQTHMSDIYRDYIRDCEQLHLDLTNEQVLFPRDLLRAHNATIEQVRFEKNRVDNEAFAAVAKKLEKLAFTRGGLLIRPAQSQRELIEEGKALNHCVGRYAGEMARGETAIFFVRRTDDPDKSFYTLEYCNKRVTQCRTLNNRSYQTEHEIDAFVNAWLEFIASGGKKKSKTKVA